MTAGRNSTSLAQMGPQPIKAEDLNILITGGARGIGGALAKRLAAKSANVLICDILIEEASALAASLGQNAHAIKLDVASEDSWRAAIDHAEDLFGSINSLFNNAGIVSFGDVESCSPIDFRNIIDVNLCGAFLGIHFCAPAIRKAGGGAILNTSSTAGLQGYARLAAYVSSKWGVRGLTKAAALDLADGNIRVASLHPGPIKTPMTAGLGDDAVVAQPVPRFGQASEVARMAEFILTEATYSTGCEFVIDGGATVGDVLHFPDQ